MFYFLLNMFFSNKEHIYDYTNTEIDNKLNDTDNMLNDTDIMLNETNNTQKNNTYYITIIIGIIGIYLYRNYYNIHKNIPKDIIYKHFTREIKQHILRSRITALYFMMVNIFTITLQLGIIYISCPDLFRLIGIMDKKDITIQDKDNKMILFSDADDF